MTKKMAVLLAALAMAVLAVAGAATAADAPEPRAATPLRITDVAPDGGSAGVSINTEPFIVFDRVIDNDTLRESGNATIKKAGAKRARPFGNIIIGNDGTISAAQLSPTNFLQPGTRYQIAIDGGRDGVRGADGSKLGGVTDPTARFKDGKVVWSFSTAE